MLRNEKLQLAGPLGLILVIVCAQIAAQALAQWPASSLLWYLDLEVLHPFRAGFDGLALAARFDPAGIAPCFWVAAPLLGLIVAGLLSRNRLPWAIASNLSLIFSVALFHRALAENVAAPGLWAALAAAATPAGTLTAAILLVALLSSTISHRCYWGDILASYGRSRSLPSPLA
jgi:hypothetical protein